MDLAFLNTRDSKSQRRSSGSSPLRTSGSNMPNSPQVHYPCNFKGVYGPTAQLLATGKKTVSKTLTESEFESESESSHIDISDDGTGTPTNASESETPSVPDDRFHKRKLLAQSRCPFGETKTWVPLYDSSSERVSVVLHASFKNEYSEDDKAKPRHHIVYRRNYFGVAMKYTLKSAEESMRGRLHFLDGSSENFVDGLSVRMRAVKDFEEGEDIPLSVFSPKRGTPINPPPHLEQRMQPDMPGHCHVYDESTGYSQNITDLPDSHDFLRLQFRKATPNNGKRRKGQTFFRVVGELWATVIESSHKETSIKIASTISGPLLVRGRCPNSFEPYNPNNRKRKPRKDLHRIGKKKLLRPAAVSRKGPKKKQARSVRDSKSEPSRRTRAQSRTMPTLILSQNSCSTSSTKLSPQVSHTATLKDHSVIHRSLPNQCTKHVNEPTEFESE